MTTTQPRVLATTRLLAPELRSASLARDVREGLTRPRKTLPSKWFYDARGSALYDEITRLPEYYPARRELEILLAHAGDVADLARADTLVELGSGTSTKTRALLDALTAAGRPCRYVPVDVDPTVLAAAGEGLARDYPELEIHPVVADFEQHLAQLPPGRRRLVAFLGGTIGNLTPGRRARFLRAVAMSMGPGDTFLLGTDLVKDTERLVAAYDDATGVTAEFNRNVLHVIRRELDTDLDPERFAHVAVWDAGQEWVEMRLQARQAHVVRVQDLHIAFDTGEHVRTEISAKFRSEGIDDELRRAGLATLARWTDPDGDYALTLAGPSS